MSDLKQLLAEAQVKHAVWHADYLEAVEKVRAQSREQFVAPGFQAWLWDGTHSAIGIGSGTGVKLAKMAYSAKDLVDELWAVASGTADDLVAAFGRILETSRLYTRERWRPRARLIRVFALLRPDEVTCIVGDGIRQALAAFGEPLFAPSADVVSNHQRLYSLIEHHLGPPGDLAERLWYSILGFELTRFEGLVSDLESAPGETPARKTDLGPGEIHDPSFWLARHPRGSLGALPLDAVAEAFDADGFVFADDMLTHMHAALTALPAKRFVVLGGLSGTGKSTFARVYADALCAVAGVDDTTRHRRFVAVRPDWTDPSGLLGHPNLLFEPPRWHRTAALSLVLDAVADPGQPYVLILEEMNLARVEHYFAPLLTAMENPAAGLRLHGLGREVEGVPPLVPWPRNLFIIGTVNMDATTQAFSDKVLDRAFIWEMHAIDVVEWHRKQRARADADDLILDPVASALTLLYAPLEVAGRHFGYRVCDEVLAFCRAAGSAEADTLDVAIFSKVLPRLRGDDHGELSAALDGVLAVCTDRGFDRCVRRIERMRRELRATGVARFWS